jgi:hypothetical protein
VSAENGNVEWTEILRQAGWSTEFIGDRHSSSISAVSDAKRREEKKGNKQC